MQERRGDFVEKLRTASDLFVYSVVDRAELPLNWVAELTHWCAERGWGVSVQGRKVYCVPRPLTKSSAAREVMRRTGADHLVAAGDSLLDAELLAVADHAVRPAQGELADEAWTTPGLHVTSAPGVVGGEELVGWLLDLAAGGPPTTGGVVRGQPVRRTRFVRVGSARAATDLRLLHRRHPASPSSPRGSCSARRASSSSRC